MKALEDAFNKDYVIGRLRTLHVRTIYIDVKIGELYSLLNPVIFNDI